MKTNDIQFYVLGYMKAMRVQTISRIKSDLGISQNESNLGMALYNLKHEGKINMSGSLVYIREEEAEAFDQQDLDPSQEEKQAH